MKSKTRTIKIGESLIVAIPKKIVKAESLHEDEMVEISVIKVKKSYFGALKGIGSFTREDRMTGQLEED